MKLYYMAGACSLATHIVLEWIGAPFEVQGFTHDELGTDKYHKLNPAGAVPALEVNGKVLTQNAAILGYLAQTHPEAKLEGDGSPEARAETHRWLGFVNSDIHPAFRNIFRAPNALKTEEARKEVIADSHAVLKRLFGLVDKQLEGRDWITGSRSIADPYLFVVTSWTKLLNVDISEHKNVARYFERLQKDPGVQKAMKAEGLL